MSKLDLWGQFAQWQQECRWVDLSREISTETPHWTGFMPMEVRDLYTLEEHGIFSSVYSLVSQYGTHADAQRHFVPGGKTLDQVTVSQMVMPLCVLDGSAEVAKNNDFVVTQAFIEEWEKVHGQIPKGSFVAFRSDWSKRPDDNLNNFDADGNKHYPGWGGDALRFLIEQRQIAAIGHETFDTDAPIESSKLGYLQEFYALEKLDFQVEVMANLDQCPPTGALIVTAFPRVRGASGFTARCFALCPK